MTKLTREAVAEHGLRPKDRRSLQELLCDGIGVLAVRTLARSDACDSSNAKFGRKPEVAAANEAALRSGWAFGETTEAFGESYQVEAADSGARHVSQHHGQPGAGLGTDRRGQAERQDELFYGTYPITPASDILHELTKYKHFGVRTFQAEDEIAAVCASIGAAFGGRWASPPAAAPASH